jgi:hypothetical protein
MEGIMKFSAALLPAMLVLCFGSAAGAGPVVDAATRAEALQAEGKTAEALDALNEAAASLWEASPLAFRKVALVDSSEGFGVYEERADRTYKPDEKIQIYVEPVGFGYGQSGDGATVNLNADMTIENNTGQVISDTKDALKFSTKTRPNLRDLGLTVSFPAPYIRPGDYKAIITLRDQNSQKNGTFEVPFAIAAP